MITLSVLCGLKCALQSGWSVHHGVAKFAANAITILGACETADPTIRILAIHSLLESLEASIYPRLT